MEETSLDDYGDEDQFDGAHTLPPMKCSLCGSYSDDMKGCGACLIPYCSIACQRKHWRTHKLVCGRENVDEQEDERQSAPRAKREKETERKRQENEKVKREAAEREKKAREEAEASVKTAREEAADRKKREAEEKRKQKKRELEEKRKQKQKEAAERAAEERAKREREANEKREFEMRVKREAEEETARRKEKRMREAQERVRRVEERLMKEEQEKAKREEERKRKAEAERRAIALMERERMERERREAEERATKESAEREAREKAEREAREKAEREKRERERVVREKKEAAERAAKERAEREARETRERERKERERKERETKEAEERAAKEKAEREAREKAEREAREKEERERKEALQREAKEREEKKREEERRAFGAALRLKPMQWEQWDASVVFEATRVQERGRLRQVCRENAKQSNLPMLPNGSVLTTVRSYAELRNVLRILPDAATPYCLLSFHDDRTIDEGDSSPMENCKEVRVSVREVLSVGDEEPYAMFVMPVASWRDASLSYEFDDDFRAGLESMAAEQANKTPSDRQKKEARKMRDAWDRMVRVVPAQSVDVCESSWKSIIDRDSTVAENYIGRGHVLVRAARRAVTESNPVREVVGYYRRAMADYARAWLLEPNKVRAANALCQTVWEMLNGKFGAHCVLPFSRRHLYTVTRDLLIRVGAQDMVASSEVAEGCTVEELRHAALDKYKSHLNSLDDVYKAAFGYAGGELGVRNAVTALVDAVAWLRVRLPTLPEEYEVALTRVGSRVLRDERCSCCTPAERIFRSPMTIDDAREKGAFEGATPSVLLDELDRVV